MRLEYQPTLNDYIAARDADSKARGEYGSKPYILWIISISCTILALNYLYSFLTSGFLMSLIFFCGFAIFCFFGVIMAPPVFLKLRNWLISVDFQKDENLHGYLVVDVDDTKIIVNSENIITEIKWQQFEYFIESPDVFNLYLSKKRFFFIATRLFLDDAALNQFKNIVTEKINKNKPFFEPIKATNRMNSRFVVLSLSAWALLMSVTALFK